MDDLAYVDLLRSADIRVIVVTSSNEQLPVSSWQHVNEKHISTELFDELIPDTVTRRVYVSGPPAIVDRTKQIMKQLGVHRVTSDYFTGY
jgi:NAD(P)H-flavin reductase